MPLQDPVALLVLGLLLLPLFLIAYWAYVAFRGAGFTISEVALILVAAPLGHGLDVVVHERGNLVLAVNLAGVLVPTLVAAKILAEDRVPRARTALAVALVAAFTYWTSHYVPGVGVRVLVLAPVALAAALGVLATLDAARRAPLVAYVAGALGVLVGADLARLAQFLALEPTEPYPLSIGGGGTLDAIFVAGVAAVALQLLLFAAPARRGRRST